MRGCSLAVFSLLATAAGGAEPPGRMVFEPSLESDRFIGRGAGGSVRVEPAAFAFWRGDARVRGRFLGARADAPVKGAERLLSQSHYLRGADPTQWRTGVPNFRRVRVTGAYPGVDIEYYQGEAGFEFDLTLEPGVDLQKVQMAFEGVESVELDDEGALVLESSGETLRQLSPRVFQRRGGKEIAIASRYRLLDDGIVSFEIGDYDQSRPLIIDPVLQWATFLGGSGQEQVNAVAVDAQGFVYAGGFTTSPDFPAANARDGAFDGPLDGFVSKLSADGSQLIWSTYLGGANREEVRGLRIDDAGNIYVSGATDSTDFPTTTGAAQGTLGGQIDGFVSKLTPNGAGFVYSTYFGGPGVENARRLAVDAAGAAYLTGEASGNAVPVTPGAFQTQNGGGFDAFVAKIDSAGAVIEWATLFGGNGTDLTFDIVANPAGGVLLGGSTNSTDFPGTANAFQRNMAGLDDGYVARFSSTGAVDYFTYIGGTGTDQVRGLAPDGAGNVWIAGGTGSQNLPTTANAPNRSFLGGPTDGFLARLPLPGASQTPPLVSYVGDDKQNFGLAIAFAPSAPVALRPEGLRQAFGEFPIFYSLSNFTTESGPYNTVTDFDQNGVAGSTATLIGSDANAAATAPAGLAVVFGGVGLSNAVATPGVYQTNFGGGAGTQPADAFVFGVTPSSVNAENVKLDKTVEAIWGPMHNGVRRDPGSKGTTGDNIEFKVTLVNEGPDDLTNVVLTDLLGPGFTDVRFFGELLDEVSGRRQGFNCSYPFPEIVCKFPALRQLEMITLIVRARIADPSFVTHNSAFAQWDGGATSESLDLRESVVPEAKLAIDMTSQLETLDSGKRVVRNTVRITNIGSTPAYNATMSESSRFPRYSYSYNSQEQWADYHSLKDPAPMVIQGSAERIHSEPRNFGYPPPGFTGHSDPVMFRAGVLNPSESFTVVYYESTSRYNPREYVNRSRASAQADNANSVDASTETAVPPNPAPEQPKFDCTAKPSPGGRVSPSAASADLPDIDVGCQATEEVRELGEFVLHLFGSDLKSGAQPPNLVVKDASGAAAQTFPSAALGAPINTASWSSVPLNKGPGGSFDATISGLTVDPSTIPPGRLLTGSLQIFVKNPDGTEEEINIPFEQPLTASPVHPDYSCSYRPVSPGVGEYTCTELSPDAIWPGDSSCSEALRSTDWRLEIEAQTGAGATVPSVTIPNSKDSGTSGGVGYWRIEEFGADFSGGQPVVSGADEARPVDPRATYLYRSSGGSCEELDKLLFMLRTDCSAGPLPPGSVRIGRAPVDLPGGSAPGSSLFADRYDNQLPAPWANCNAPISAVEAPAANVGAAGLTGPPVAGGLSSLFLPGPQAGAETVVANGTPLKLTEGQARLLILINSRRLNPQSAKSTEPQSPQQGASPLGVFAPLLFVSPTQINYQVPWELAASAGPAQAQLIINGVASPLFDVEVAQYSPAVFTFDFGPGRAVAINPDGSVAHPVNSFAGAVTSRPVRRGEALILYATGLGVVTPPAINGHNSLDLSGAFVRRDTVTPPRVTIGGVEQQVLFSGLSPQFIGVYQLNILLGEATPTGDTQPLVIEIGGARSRDDVTVAVAP